MNCRQAEKLMSAYLDGELPGVEMLGVKGHVSTCQSCAEEFESIRSVKRLMSNLSNVTPREGFAATICARLDDSLVPRYLRVWNRIATYSSSHMNPAIAALGAVGVALMLMTAGSIGDYQPTNVASFSALPTTIQPVVESGVGQLRLASVQEAPIVPTNESIWFTNIDYMAH